MAVYFRSDQASIGVTVEGVSLGNESWDVLEGADNAVDVITLLPGGMAPQVAKGGIPKRSNGTVKRLWSESLILQYKALDAVAGNANITVTYTVLNTNKTPAFAPITYTGVIGTVSRPNYDATKSEAAYLTVEFGLNGEVS